MYVHCTLFITKGDWIFGATWDFVRPLENTWRAKSWRQRVEVYIYQYWIHVNIMWCIYVYKKKDERERENENCWKLMKKKRDILNMNFNSWNNYLEIF